MSTRVHQEFKMTVGGLGFLLKPDISPNSRPARSKKLGNTGQMIMVVLLHGYLDHQPCPCLVAVVPQPAQAGR
jgi:hypothetical protein